MEDSQPLKLERTLSLLVKIYGAMEQFIEQWPSG